ncbi:WD repeat-containing and planar cell polarity effector protein fritz homolog [Adelges cooleyi]|uniref:WD repeat-containing and planar cell polarity effector protein fritz homolog n=1 Tax=Adelges cooleyi TaxID=133065 RepID=UPI00217FB876|nr:WD repeat-containing and planar cell polarity effector protein fritz homolog [Adelges cooleyi]
MLTFLCELHYWTLKNDLAVESTDFSHFRYNEKKETESSTNKIIKKNYTEGRGCNWSLSNKRPKKLKDSLKAFETELNEHHLIAVEWLKKDKIAFVFNNGSTTFITFDATTCDLIEIVSDKFLQSKFSYQSFIDISYLKQVLLCSFSDHKLGIVHFGRPFDNTSNKWSLLEPKVGLFDFNNHTVNRKNERKITVNVSATVVATWCKSTANEVYPWSPVVKDEDRANIHVYKIIGPRLELCCYHRTKQDPLIVTFSKTISNILFILEKKDINDPQIEFSTFEVTNTKLHLINTVTVSPFDWCSASIINVWLNGDDTRLCFSYDDSVLFLHDFKLSITCSVKTAFPVEFLDWHPDGNIIAVSDNSGRIQCFDSCLSQISIKPLTADAAATNSATYLNVRSKVGSKKIIQLKWLSHHDTARYTANPCDSVLQLVFEKGPVVSVKLLGAGKLTADLIISMYLTNNEVDCALNFLLGLDWHCNGPLCLTCLQKITNYLFRLPFTPIREVQIQSAIGSFFQPIIPLSDDIKQEYYEPVRNIARRFFHQLVRYELYEKAFSLAIDLNNRDLFMDLYWATKSGIGTRAMATMALEKANQIISSESDDSHSTQSSSNCECTDCHSSSRSETMRPPLPIVSTTLSPPLLLVPPVPANKTFNNITTISVPYATSNEEPNMSTNIELPTSSLDSVPHLRYPLEQQLLSQNILQESSNQSTHASAKPQSDKTIKVVHFGIV